MRHLFEARLVNDAFGDPGLYIDFRDERRALLFDLGDIAALPPRKLLRVSHVFVSHTHMDHFVGFDQMLRVVLGRKPQLALMGGPGFVDQLEHRLRAYTWNVVHRYTVELVLDVREVGTDGRGLRARFSSRTGFAREPAPPFECVEDVLHDDALFRVRGRFVDHEMPCLAFVVEEKPRPRVAKDRLAALGVRTGPWLRELKLALMAAAPPDTMIRLHWRDREGEHEMSRSVGELSGVFLDTAPGRRIGYATDLRFTEANRRTLAALLAGVDQLFIESVFLEADADHALRKNHLTARQAGQIARELGARAVLPFHFSPRYEQRAGALVAEVLAAWSGAPARDGGPGPDCARSMRAGRASLDCRLTMFLPFADRQAAGKALARAVSLRHFPAPRVVLALPRGGVPVALEVARALDAPLDLVLVRKIGAPWQPELAVAAVVDGAEPEIVVDEETSALTGVDRAYIEAQAAQELREIERRRRVYLRGRAPLALEGVTTIVVDDGVATGTTVRAALRALRRRHPARLVLAVPVAPADTVSALRAEVDELICLAEPSPFHAIGLYYHDFHQVPDDEVLAALDAARGLGGAPQPD